MKGIKKNVRMATGMAMLLICMTDTAATDPAARLAGTWGVDVQKLNEVNPEMRKMSPEERAEIQRELAQLSFVFDAKTVTMTDRNGEQTSSPYRVVSKNDQLVVLELAQEDGGTERLRIRFMNDERMELVREGDDGSLYLVKR